MMITKAHKGKASGKFILLGEHFVIEKVPALVFPLHEVFTEVKVQPNHHPHYKANLVGDEDIEAVESMMARATYAAANSLRMDIASQPLKVESTMNFPVSRGFGSSASFAVALVRALDSYRRTLIPDHADWNELVKATSAIEQIFHGRPSGADAAVILAGRPIRFENGAVLREVNNKAVDFVLVDSGGRENCAVLVRDVQDFRARDPKQWERMAEVMTGLVENCEKALGGDANGVAQAVRTAQGILTELNLSNPEIDTLIERGRAHGALAGKVSGAGGGGAVVLVAERGKGAELARKLRDDGISVIGVDGGSNG